MLTRPLFTDHPVLAAREVHMYLSLYSVLERSKTRRAVSAVARLELRYLVHLAYDECVTIARDAGGLLFCAESSTSQFFNDFA